MNSAQTISTEEKEEEGEEGRGGSCNRRRLGAPGALLFTVMLVTLEP
jgi:hypothetical protein